MNIEMLKEVTALIQSLGGSAQTALIWWLAAGVVSKVLVGGFVVAGVVILTRTIRCLVASDGAMRQLRDAADIGRPGLLGDGELAFTLRHYMRLQNAYRESKAVR